ncbi:hypothetical protein ACFJIX_06975 [Roseateles sp. UC29_93]|uniref:hypothetical protein n=1 Tax=Roseateles sp. UC29_93 TaxID=3350177 RepID=UPI00366F8D91
MERRFASLNQSMLEQGWFYPVVLDLEAEEAAAEDGEAPAEGAAEASADAAVDAEAEEPVDPDAPQLPEDPITQALLPWVGGFEYAAVTFPTCMSRPTTTSTRCWRACIAICRPRRRKRWRSSSC